MKPFFKPIIFFILLSQFLFGSSYSFSQISDTLSEFSVEEVLSEHKTFSSIKIIDSTIGFDGINTILQSKFPVYIKDYGNGQLATISIRGNGASQTQVFWNGFAMNPPNVAQSDLSLLPAFFISDATLNYSGASTVNGSGGIGGSLNLGTDKNWRNGIHGGFAKEYASFSNATSLYQLSYGNNKFFNELKIIRKKGKNDFKFTNLEDPKKPILTQINQGLKQSGFQYNLGYFLNAKNKLSSSVQYLNSRREIPPFFAGFTNNEFQEDVTIRSFVSWKSYQKKFKTDVRIAYFDDKNHYTDSVWGVFSENDSRSFQAQGRLNYSLPYSMDVEVSVQHISSEAKSKDYESTHTRKESGLYVKLSQRWKSFYYELFIRQELIDNSFSPLVYGAGIKYELWKDKLSLFSNYSTNYRAPSLNDLYWDPGGNLNLQPEKGWTAELGISMDVWRKKSITTNQTSFLKVNVTGFTNKTDNWIQWEPTPNFYWSPVNFKSIKNQGVESGIEFNNAFSRQTNLSVALFYTFTDSKNSEFANGDESLVGRQTIYIPKYKGTVNLEFNYRDLILSYNHQFTSEVLTSYAAANNELPSFNISNAQLNYAIPINKVRLGIGFGINNIFDVQYRVVPNRPQPGRNLSGIISFIF